MATQTTTWNAPEVLEHNRQRRLARLTKELRDFERRYEIASDALEQELTAGRIKETEYVCNWLMVIHTSRMLSGE